MRCPVCRFDIRDHSTDPNNIERQNSVDSSATVGSDESTNNNNNEVDSDDEYQETSSRIDMSGNRIRYIVEYEMPNSEYILYIPDASTNSHRIPGEETE